MREIWLQATEYVNTPDWLERKSWHDTIWLLAPVLAILIAGPIWFFRLVDVDMNSLSWTLFSYSLLREVANFYLKRAQNLQLVLRCTFLADFLGICLLGLLWHFSQTVRDPLFLVVMMIPLIAGSLIYPSFITYGFTGISIVTVLSFAWVDVPQFRAVMLQTSLIPAWVAAKINIAGWPGADASATDLSAASAAAILVAFCFSFVIIACIVDGLRHYFMAALQSRSTQLAVLSAERRPAFSINRHTLAITSANKAFYDYSLTDPTKGDPLALARSEESAAHVPTLFDVIRFEEEHDLREIIAGQGGAMVCHYHIGPESRMGRVQVEVLPDGTQCQLALEDLSAENYLRLTLDVLDQAVILLAESEVVLYFNNAAARLFPALADGVEASSVLQTETLGSPWWELGASSSHNRNVRLNGRTYHTACTAAQLPGQQMPISVLSLSEV